MIDKLTAIVGAAHVFVAALADLERRGELGLFGFRFLQRAPVRNRDLIVVGVYFVEGEEAVTVPAIFDKGGLQRGFDPRHARQIDVAS